MTFLRKISVPLICLVLVWTGTGMTGDLPDSKNITELEPMVVSGKKSKDNPEVIVLDRHRIQTPLQSGNILELLEGEAGIQVRRQSQSGTGSNSLRIRGFDETRISVRQDGIPLNRDGSYGNGPIDWGSFSSQSLESIEIFKGACPAKYGNTLGGVVNLTTKTPADTPSTQVNLSAGSLDTLDAGISHAWKKGVLGWSLSAGHFETDGYLRNNYMDRDRGSARFFWICRETGRQGPAWIFLPRKTGIPCTMARTAPIMIPVPPWQRQRN